MILSCREIQNMTVRVQWWRLVKFFDSLRFTVHSVNLSYNLLKELNF